MIQVFHNTNFRLMWGTKYIFMVLSAVIFLIAVGAITIHGFNLGIDFAGGTAVRIKFREQPRVDDLRMALEAAQLGDINIQRMGERDDNEVLIRVEQQAVVAGTEGGEISSEISEALRTPDDRAAEQEGLLDLNHVSESALVEWLRVRVEPGEVAGEEEPIDVDAIAGAVIRHRTDRGGILSDRSEIATLPIMTPAVITILEEQTYLGPFVLRSVDFVGPTAGRELIRNTRLAIIFSVVGILIYIWIRFHRMAWGVAALLALIHDVTISAGAMALSGKEFSLPVVAALLTILGYSINDTIVIFDRIRENIRLYRDQDFEMVTNVSINQTLSRSVLTSFTFFVAVTSLFLYGGDKLNPLSFCLMIGVVVGSYSSIFIASAFLVIAYRYFGPRYIKA